MSTRPIVHADLPALASLAAPLQAKPESHCVYLAEDAAGIVGELEESTWEQVGVALADAEVDGWLIGDIDEEIGRVWWLGPFVGVDLDDAAWTPHADTLLAAARDRLPASITEEEMAVDERAHGVIDWSRRHGFEPTVGSFIAELDASAAASLAPPARPVRPIVDVDHDAVAHLHDHLFPGTHTTGRQLVAGQDDRHRRLVVDVEGRVAGYVAVELQPDGSGYIDYLGVDPAMRRRGLGADLVRAGVSELCRIGAHGVGLSVREDSIGAQELYESLGFEIGRRVVPLRRGFAIDPG